MFRGSQSAGSCGAVAWQEHLSLAVLSSGGDLYAVMWGVSWNRGTPKSSILRGFLWFFPYKPSILRYPHLWNASCVLVLIVFLGQQLHGTVPSNEISPDSVLPLGKIHVLKVNRPFAIIRSPFFPDSSGRWGLLWTSHLWLNIECLENGRWRHTE